MKRLRGRHDDGMSLIELLVTTILMGVISSLVLTAVIQSQRVLTHDEDENRGLQDSKVIMDRLGRDVREARGVVCDAGPADPTFPTVLDVNCEAHLQLWVDSNSDYVQQNAEVITWRLQKSADEHYDVFRTTGTGPTPLTRTREASSLWTQFAFKYDAVDPSGYGIFSRVQAVKIEIQYDAIVGRGTKVRSAAFSARLRNKGA